MLKRMSGARDKGTQAANRVRRTAEEIIPLRFIPFHPPPQWGQPVKRRETNREPASTRGRAWGNLFLPLALSFRARERETINQDKNRPASSLQDRRDPLRQLLLRDAANQESFLPTRFAPQQRDLRAL